MFPRDLREGNLIPMSQIDVFSLDLDTFFPRAQGLLCQDSLSSVEFRNRLTAEAGAGIKFPQLGCRSRPMEMPFELQKSNIFGKV